MKVLLVCVDSGDMCDCKVAETVLLTTIQRDILQLKVSLGCVMFSSVLINKSDLKWKNNIVVKIKWILLFFSIDLRSFVYTKV